VARDVPIIPQEAIFSSWIPRAGSGMTSAGPFDRHEALAYNCFVCNE
jgi:hypothetical protein